MSNIMTTTIIRGTGECKVFMDGVLNKEIEKMNERHQKELSILEAKLESSNNHRDDLLTSRLAFFRACDAKHVSWFARFKERIEILWCQAYGLGEAFKLWLYEK